MIKYYPDFYESSRKEWESHKSSKKSFDDLTVLKKSLWLMDRAKYYTKHRRELVKSDANMKNVCRQARKYIIDAGRAQTMEILRQHQQYVIDQMNMNIIIQQQNQMAWMMSTPMYF